MDPEDFDSDQHSNLPRKNHLSEDDCEALRALIPAYSLGATDPDETRLVESLLEVCPDVAAELTAYNELADRLLFSATPVKAPARLRDRVLASVGSHRVPETDGKAERRPLLQSSLDSRWRLGLAGTAIAFILFGLSNLYWGAQIAGLQDSQRETMRQMEDHTDVLTLIGVGETHRFELSSPEGDALAVMVCDWDEPIGLLYAEDLPPLRSGMVYHVWLLHDEIRVSAGTFDVDENGEGVLIFRTDQPIGYYESAEITLEEPNATQPTSPALATGRLSY